MNRARQELTSFIFDAEARIEAVEREAARRRWDAESECDVFLCRAQLGQLKKESER